MTHYYKDLLGDSALYAGMLHHVGDTEAQKWVDDCIDEEGRLWRNPFTAVAQEDTHSQTTASRDMFIGALLGACDNKLDSLAYYLHQNKSLLTPISPDNRNYIGWGGWAKLYLVIPGTFYTLPLWRKIQAKLGFYSLGLSMLIAVLFSYKPYEINLVYADIMFYRRHNVLKLWVKAAMWLLKHARRKGDGVFFYLDGNIERLHDRAATARDIVARRQADGTYHRFLAEWPPSNEPYFFAHECSSEIYARWLVYAYVSITGKQL